MKLHSVPEPSFGEAAFCAEAKFVGTQFLKAANFSDSFFFKILRLDSIKIKEYASFHNAKNHTARLSQ